MCRRLLYYCTVLVEQDAETNLVDKRCHDNDRLPAVTLVFVLLLLFSPAIDYLQQIDLQLKISRVSISSCCKKKMDVCSCGLKLSKQIFYIGLHMKGSYARLHVHVYLNFSLYIWLASYDLVQRGMQFRRGDFFAGTLQCVCLSRMCDSGIRTHIFGHAPFLLNSEAKLKC